jgi:hypothetical protein
MNDKQKIVTIILALACNFTFLLTAQTPHGPGIQPLNIPECITPMGKDTMETRKHMAYFQEDWKYKDYNNAYKHLTYMVQNAPCAYKSVYQIGPMLIANMLDNPNYAGRKQGLLDTLMMLFPARIKYFGEAPLVNGSHAYYISRYNPAQVDKVINLFNEYFFFYPGYKDARYVGAFMRHAMIAMQAGLYNKSQACELYVYLSDTADAYLKAAESGAEQKQWAGTRYSIDKSLLSNITCADIDSIYAKPLQFAPEDKELLRHTIKLYRVHNTCLPQASFAAMQEQYFKLAPSPEEAEVIGRFFEKYSDRTKARFYYEKAIELASTDSAREQIYMQLMSLCRKYDFPAAAAYALNALQINSRNGTALIIQGISMYKTRCGDKFQQAMAAGAAIDLFKKAKTLDPSCTKEANAQIAAHKKFLPQKADVLSRKLKSGAPYTIACSGYQTTIQTR